MGIRGTFFFVLLLICEVVVIDRCEVWEVSPGRVLGEGDNEGVVFDCRDGVEDDEALD